MNEWNYILPSLTREAESGGDGAKLPPPDFDKRGPLLYPPVELTPHSNKAVNRLLSEM